MAEDWQAVAEAINARMAELPMNQRDLADRSAVSIATIREIQRGSTARRRSARTLASISEALEWPESYLQAVLTGATPPAGSASARQGGELSLVLSRLDQIQGEVHRLANAVDRLAREQHAVREG